ncbi:hypothetical protein F5H01DRAFT_121226 [Linnemannia elongata]|nr:hypothetical protein F5H01DRAFT_121226 [Linnemannia elongata]
MTPVVLTLPLLSVPCSFHSLILFSPSHCPHRSSCSPVIFYISLISQTLILDTNHHPSWGSNCPTCIIMLAHSGKVKEHMPKGTESYMSPPHPWLRLCWSPPNCWLGTARVGFTQHGVDLPSTPPLFSPPQGFRLLWLLASIPVSCLCQPWITHFLSRLCRSHPFILKNWIPCHPIWWSSVVKELFVCREKRVFRGSNLSDSQAHSLPFFLRQAQ